MRENATSNANACSISSCKQTSLPLPLSGSAWEVGRDGAGHAGGGDVHVDGDIGRGSTAWDIIKTKGFQESPRAHRFSQYLCGTETPDSAHIIVEVQIRNRHGEMQWV